MTGINITTAARSGPSSDPAPQSARYFLAGQTERGPAGTPVLVTSIAQLEAVFGTRVSYGSVYDDVRTYFEEGGAEAVIVRVVGPAATLGTLTVNTATSTPAVKFDAIGAGAWSTRVKIVVAAGSAANTFRVNVLLDDRRVETFDQLTIDTVSSRLTASGYVRATALGATAPANTAATGVALSAGTDDRASITTSIVVAALDAFGETFGPGGVVSLPGYSADLVAAGLTAHANANRRIALTAAAAGTTPTAVATLADGLVTDAGSTTGLVYPWVRIPTGGGGSRLISPEGYAAACRARAHRQVGAWQAPAGEIAAARFVIGVETVLTRTQLITLDDANVTPIRVLGTPRLYGWRSLSTDEANFALLSGRDVLNTIALLAEQALEDLVWGSIDARGQYLSRVASRLIGVLEPMRAAGGLFERIVDGETVDPGYSVNVSDALNPVSSLQANRVAAAVTARVSPVGQDLDLLITKAGLTASV